MFVVIYTPITNHDNAMLQDAYAKMMAEQVEADLKAKAKKESTARTPEKPKATAKPKAGKAPKAPPIPPTAPPADIQGNGTAPEPAKERELVTA